jgi:hypothetical protein
MMGTSLTQLDAHYWARAAALTTEQGQEWLNICP